jgi:hypothetical protein
VLVDFFVGGQVGAGSQIPPSARDGETLDVGSMIASSHPEVHTY